MRRAHNGRTGGLGCQRPTVYRNGSSGGVLAGIPRASLQSVQGKSNGRPLSTVRHLTSEDGLAVRADGYAYLLLGIAMDTLSRFADLPRPQDRAERWAGARPSDASPRFHQFLRSPVLGAVHEAGQTARRAHGRGKSTVEDKDNQPDRDFAWFRCGDDGDVPTLRAADRSIRQRTVKPTRVNVSDLGDGALFLQIWPDGPSVYLSRNDAGPFMRELARALRSGNVRYAGGQERG